MLHTQSNPLTEDVKLNLITELKDDRFVQQYLTSNSNDIFHYQTKYGPITINVISYSKDYFYQTLVSKLIRRCFILWKKFKIKQPVTYWIIPTKRKRRLPNKGQIVSTEHINGGYTYLYTGVTIPIKIYITTLEEFTKVALHEILHHSIINTKFDNKILIKLYSLFNIDRTNCDLQCNTEFDLNEAIVEFWAEIMQIKFVSYETGIPPIQLLKKEQEYVISKAADLLNHQQNLKNKLWSENTNAYNYIIIRGIFLTHIDEFIKITIPYEPKKIVHFIKKYWDSFQKLIKLQSNDKSNTLRMTSIIGNL